MKVRIGSVTLTLFNSVGPKMLKMFDTLCCCVLMKPSDKVNRRWQARRWRITMC